MNEERWEDPDAENPRCVGCGQRMSRHEVDQMSLRYKCPVVREEPTTPPQEHRRSPSGDY